jgi:hypothetical protein
MNEDLKQIVLYYTTKSHKELNDLLLTKSKDNLIASLTDLLTAYINDKNSSSLREFVTVSIAGYNHNTKKLGYNGYKHNTNIGGKPIMCEAKPKNICTVDYDSQKTKTKLNGQGNFTDYTPERLEKDLKENLNMLISGFIDGELQYIIEYPFKSLKSRLDSQLPRKRIIGQYTRSASFTYEHYKDCKKLKILFLNNQAIIKNEKFFNKKFYTFLTK